MRVLFYTAVVFGCALYAAAQTSQPSDLTIVTRTTVGQFSFTRTEYIKGSRSRIESIDSSERPAWNGGPTIRIFGHPRAMIFQCDQHELLELDLLTHEYTTTEINEQGMPARHASPIATQPSGGALTVTVETTDTGERKEFFGYAARHFITKQTSVPGPGAVSLGSQSEQDGWYIDLDANAGCGHHTTTVAGGGVLMATSTLSVGVPVIDKVERNFVGVPVAGFPVEVTRRSLPDGRGDVPSRLSVFKSDVTELSTAPLDPALFDVPKGFTKVDRLNYQASPSLSSQAQVWWYMIKQNFPTIFR